MRSQFLARAGQYIVEALSHNQRVEYVGDADRTALRAELAGVPGVPENWTVDRQAATQSMGPTLTPGPSVCRAAA